MNSEKATDSGVWEAHFFRQFSMEFWRLMAALMLEIAEGIYEVTFQRTLWLF